MKISTIKKSISLILVIAIACAFGSSAVNAMPAISNGENAIDLFGQSVANDNVTNDYAATGANDGAALYGLYSPDDSTIDSVHHRLFLSDKSNNRVLVFNLNGSNQLADRTPDNVLGQSSFFTDASAVSQSGMNLPRGLAYDSVNDRLFVTDSQNHRVLVFDTATISDGENAVSVLGQTDFVSGAATVNQARMSTPVGLSYDSANSRLFVAQTTGNRVTVYDVTSITNGENAVNVLGQTNFTNLATGNTQAGMNQPRGLAYDSTNSRLFVSQGNNRVTVYNAAIGTLIPNGAGNGANATAVLGQSTYTGTTAANTQSGMNQPQGLTYESANSRLFVAQSGNNRVTVYDVAAITNGENAINVLGQANYTAIASTNTQAGMNSPQGLAYDASNDRLFVLQSGNNRATVYNAAIGTLIPNGAGNGANAIDVIGQSTADDGVTADYTTFGPNEGPKLYGLSDPNHIEIDLTHHRLFVSESAQGRILVYNLNASNQLVDKTPDFVLGQPNFYNVASTTTQSGTTSPKGMAYDSVNDRLFVVDFGNHRVLVFDTATIVNGENAVNVIGQSNFTNSALGNTQSGMNNPIDLALDITNNRLFVEQTGNNRVTVYNVEIGTLIPNNAGTNGPNAIAVLGQANYTATAAANTQAGLGAPQGIAYDSVNQRLFVSQSSYNRVSVFDVNSITNGENAINILGQTTFTSTASAITQAGMSFPRGLTYDSATKRLFVSQAVSNRITVYNVDPANLIANTPATDGPNAINVLGQSTYTASTATNTQSGLNVPFDLAYDSSNDLLYVVEVTGNRVKIFNANASASPTVSGNVYTDEGSTAIADGKTVRLLINGASAQTTTTSGGTGAYSFTNVTFGASDILTVHIDGAAETGVTVTRMAATNVTGLNIYQDHLIVRDENGTSLSASDLNTANDGDADIVSIYSDGATPTVSAGKELYVWTGKTFSPGAALDVNGSLEIASGATLNMATNTMNVAQNLVNGGTLTFTAGTDLTFDGGSAQTFNPGSSDLGCDIFTSGASTAVTLSTNALNIGPNNLTVAANTTFALAGVGLTANVLSNNGTVQLNGSNTINLTTQDIDSGSWEYVGDGIASATTHTIKDFGATDYFDLSINDTSASNSDTFQLGGDFKVAGSLTVTDGAFSGSNETIDIDGSLSIGAEGIMTSTSSSTFTLGGNLTNAGTFTHNSGTITLDGVNQSITPTATTTFSTLVKSEASSNDSLSSTLTLGGNISIAMNLTLDGLDANDKILIVSSDPPTARSITFTGSSTFTGDYLTITDNTVIDSSNGISGALNPLNSVDGGNTSGWFSAPTVMSVNSSTPDDTYGIGGVISIQINFSESVNVTGIPQLTLETGTTDAVVNYSSGSGSDTLNFTYTVATGENSADLDYVSTSALSLNGGGIIGTINAATLTLPTPGASGSLANNKAIVINTMPPASPAKNLLGIQIENAGPLNIIVDKMEVSWTPSTPTLTSITIGGSAVWVGSASSGTLIDINDVTIPIGTTIDIDSLGFDTSVAATSFTIIFTMKDGTTKTSNFSTS